MSEFKVTVDADTTLANKKLNDTEGNRQRLENMVTDTVSRSKMSFNQVLSMAQQSWGVIDAMFRAMGFNVSMQFRLLIRSGFAAIRVLTPIFTAEALTPGMQAQAAFGMLNLVLAAMAIAEAEAGATQSATQIAAATEGISGINSMIGSMSFM
ncbi:MAG: hypothetical protein GY834_02305 [Bacteroidetes bacterium]|nr:hypothetical protein [Bacteroidota bacterium]